MEKKGKEGMKERGVNCMLIKELENKMEKELDEEKDEKEKEIKEEETEKMERIRDVVPGNPTG